MEANGKKKNRLELHEIFAEKIFDYLWIEWQLGIKPPPLEKIYHDFSGDLEVKKDKFDRIKGAILYLRQLGQVKIVKDPDHDLIRVAKPPLL